MPKTGGQGVDKTQGAALLLDFYGKLLTKRQADILDIYVNDDYSLSEIAENFGVSRQAVHDMIKSGMAALRSCEEKLGFAEAYRRNIQTAKQLDADADELIRLLESCRGEPGEQSALGEHKNSGELGTHMAPEKLEEPCAQGEPEEPGAQDGSGAQKGSGDLGEQCASGARASAMLSIARGMKARIRDME
jgi:predicted DNA-binding protein YlxM (UPF0122 family)